MIEIPDTELMAEKLGMIVLCEYFARIVVWQHEDTNNHWCEMRKVEGKCITGSYGPASPRKGPLADQYKWEPK
jgi:hypothetical protein